MSYFKDMAPAQSGAVIVSGPPAPNQDAAAVEAKVPSTITNAQESTTCPDQKIADTPTSATEQEDVEHHCTITPTDAVDIPAAEPEEHSSQDAATDEAPVTVDAQAASEVAQGIDNSDPDQYTPDTPAAASIQEDVPPTSDAVDLVEQSAHLAASAEEAEVSRGQDSAMTGDVQSANEASRSIDNLASALIAAGASTHSDPSPSHMGKVVELNMPASAEQRFSKSGPNAPAQTTSSGGSPSSTIATTGQHIRGLNDPYVKKVLKDATQLLFDKSTDQFLFGEITTTGPDGAQRTEKWHDHMASALLDNTRVSRQDPAEAYPKFVERLVDDTCRGVRYVDHDHPLPRTGDLPATADPVPTPYDPQVPLLVHLDPDARGIHSQEAMPVSAKVTSPEQEPKSTPPNQTRDPAVRIKMAMPTMDMSKKRTFQDPAPGVTPKYSFIDKNDNEFEASIYDLAEMYLARRNSVATPQLLMDAVSFVRKATSTIENIEYPNAPPGTLWSPIKIEGVDADNMDVNDEVDILDAFKELCATLTVADGLHKYFFVDFLKHPFYASVNDLKKMKWRAMMYDEYNRGFGEQPFDFQARLSKAALHFTTKAVPIKMRPTKKRKATEANIADDSDIPQSLFASAQSAIDNSDRAPVTRQPEPVVKKSRIDRDTNPEDISRPLLTRTQPTIDNSGRASVTSQTDPNVRIDRDTNPESIPQPPLTRKQPTIDNSGRASATSQTGPKLKKSRLDKYADSEEAEEAKRADNYKRVERLFENRISHNHKVLNGDESGNVSLSSPKKEDFDWDEDLTLRQEIMKRQVKCHDILESANHLPLTRKFRAKSQKWKLSNLQSYYAQVGGGYDWLSIEINKPKGSSRKTSTKKTTDDQSDDHQSVMGKGKAKKVADKSGTGGKQVNSGVIIKEENGSGEDF